MKKVLFSAHVDSHILAFHIPYLKYFKDHGYEVHVATNGNEEIPYCDKKYVVSFERSPFKFNNIKAIKSLKKIINEEKYDIIHTHTPMGGVVTRLAARYSRKKYNTRVIYTAHGFHFFKGAPVFNWLFFYPVEKLLARCTDQLITINKEDYELASKKFKTKVYYVAGVGIDEKKFDFEMTEKEKLELRNSLGLKKDDFVMIYPAELNKNKNQIFLIDIMTELVKKYDDIHLLLPGKDSYNKYYQKIVSERGLEKNIHFLGFRSDIPSLLKISNLSVASSFREGLPVNIMEAMYVGLPIVALSSRGTNDLVEDGVNGFIIELNDSGKFVDIISDFYNNRKDIKLFYKNNILKAKNYLLDNVLMEYSDIYENNRKKILHVLSSNKFSGAENVVCTIIDFFQNEYDMYYCSPGGPIEEKLKQKKIHFCRLKRLDLFSLKKIIKIYKPDIIQAHDVKASLFCSFFYRKSKLISHIHFSGIGMNYKNIKSVLYNFASKKFDKIIWVSDSSYDTYIYKDNVAKKSIVLQNVIKPTKPNAIEEKFDIAFVGRMNEIKNPLRSLEIIKNVSMSYSDVRAVFVGDGELLCKIKEKVLEYNLSNNVILTGFVDNPLDYLGNSKLMLMTSVSEGTPMCALEALSLGVPIISTRTNGLLELIDNGKNGYISDDDDEIVRIIYDLIRDNRKLNTLKSLTIKHFKKINNVEQYKEKLNQLYK